MARQPRVVGVSDEEYAEQKKAKAARSLRYLVTGDMPIRDAISRESKYNGEHVWLDPEETIIVLLERSGFVKAAPEAADSKAKAGKDA